MDFLDTKQFIRDINRKKEELEKASDNLLAVQKILKNKDLDGDDFEYLYEREFQLLIEISGLYNDMHRKLNKLYKEVPEQRFFVSRMKKEIEEYKTWETIEI